MNWQMSVNTKTQKLRSKLLVIPLIKLYCKFKLYALKRALLIRLDLTNLLGLKIRHLTPKARLAWFDEHFDDVINIVTKNMLHPQTFDPELQEVDEQMEELYKGVLKDYDESKDSIDQLIGEFDGIKDISTLKQHYWLICQYTKKLIDDPKAAKFYFKLAQNTPPDSKELEIKDV